MSGQHPTIPGVTVSTVQWLPRPNRVLHAHLTVCAYISTKGEPHFFVEDTNCKVADAETVCAMILDSAKWLNEQKENA